MISYDTRGCDTQAICQHATAVNGDNTGTESSCCTTDLCNRGATLGTSGVVGVLAAALIALVYRQ